MIGEGGKTKIIEDWKAEDNQLTALTYDYRFNMKIRKNKDFERKQ